MYTEVFSVVIILGVCWVTLAVLDVAVAGLLAWILGLSFKRCFTWGLLSLAVPVLLMGYGILIERNCVRVNTVEVAFDNLPKAFDGYSIVQLSDIHSRSFRYRTGTLQRMVEKVNSLDADLIAFTGDIVTISPDELDATEEALRGLKAHDGVVSILGNHDYCPYIKEDKSGEFIFPDGVYAMCPVLRAINEVAADNKRELAERIYNLFPWCDAPRQRLNCHCGCGEHQHFASFPLTG